jgi:chitin disaccharide deacetylase
MIIINADDFGKTRNATDKILSCFNYGSVTSTSAMVFMDDSIRAAELAKEYHFDVGLHLNFTQELTQPNIGLHLCEYHNRIRKYLVNNKYNALIYNPSLRKNFQYVFRSQIEEFENLYGKSPSHINGHHHMHLCANMLLEQFIPKNQKVRRNFTFNRGEKGIFNLAYRTVVDLVLSRRYIITDYFFSLYELIRTGRVAAALELAKKSVVEIETHPEMIEEYVWLVGDSFIKALVNLQRGTYAKL